MSKQTETQWKTSKPHKRWAKPVGGCRIELFPKKQKIKTYYITHMQDLMQHCVDSNRNDLSSCSHVFTLKIRLDFIDPRGQVCMVQRP